MDMYIDLNRGKLIKDLQTEVVEYLLEQNVVSQQEYDRIISYEAREDSITYLLEVLINKTDSEKMVFLNYTNDSYSWFRRCFEVDFPKQKDEQDLRNVLDAGEVPALPSGYVERKEAIQLVNQLRLIKRNEYVVVHGMVGCGKSTLVSSVLHEYPDLVLRAFEKRVFWVSARGLDSLTLLLDLCGRLTSFHTIQPLPTELEAAKRYLKDRFNRDEMLEALLILVNVPSADFIRTLDVGCKILITTNDISVMRECQKRYYSLKVSDGFSEEQSLTIFARGTELPLSELPLHAKNIHALCKGFPLAISLIASQLTNNKEDTIRNTDRWKEYESQLKQGGIKAAIGRYDKANAEVVNKLYSAIDLSISHLDPEMRTMYLTFALFMEDVNIRPEVLSILWDKSKYEVIDIMNEFERKRLVCKKWIASQNTYIFCIHDFFLSYLKASQSELEKKELHRHFIDCYRKRYGDDFTDFPADDNYILLYLGYHLIEADMIEEFPGLYLNLKFIEKKIVHYGAADLLFDLKKYKSHIARDEANTKKYEDFMHFIRRVAATCRPISNCNLVQFALCESKESEVYKAGMELQNRRGDRCFKMLTSAPVEDSPPIVFVDRDEITRAAFLHSKNILVANAKGVIRRIDLRMDPLFSTQTFEGHTDRVTELLVKNQRSQSFFLSASLDSTVRVWNANGSIFNSGASGDFDNRRTPSPQWKQNEWHDNWPDVRSAGEKAVAILNHGAPVKCARFSNNPSNLHVVSVDADGRLRIHLLSIETDDFRVLSLAHDTRVINDTGKTDITCCSFSNDDALVLYTCAGGSVYVHHARSGDLVRRLELRNNDVKSMIIVPETPHITALILGASDFSVFTIDPIIHDPISELTPETPDKSYGCKRKDNYVCAAVSWDGKYVAVATTTYNIFIYDTETAKEVLKFSENNGKISNMSWSLQNDFLLTTYERSRIMKKYAVPRDGVLNNSVKLKQHAFDAVWISGKCVTAALDNRNRVHRFDGLDKTDEIVPQADEKIVQVCVCPLEGEVVYALDDGEVRLVDEEHTRAILHFRGERVLAMKAFADRRGIPPRTRTIVVALATASDNDCAFSLLGWRRNACEDELTDEAVVEFQTLPQTAVRYFDADLNNNLLYVVAADHRLSVYDLVTGELRREEDLVPRDEMKFCDISSNFERVVTGSETHVIVRWTGVGDALHREWMLESAARACKFSPNAKYLAVGYDNSNIEVRELESELVFRLKDDHRPKFSPGPVLEISWSPHSDQFIVIFEREVALYLPNDGIELCATLYMSVDKLISDPTFTKSVTVDSSGHFRVFEHSC